jgi:hypothetical protein
MANMLLQYYIYIVANAEDSKLATAGVSFTVNFQEGDPTRMPSRLADRLNGTVSPTIIILAK